MLEHNNKLKLPSRTNCVEDHPQVGKGIKQGGCTEQHLAEGVETKRVSSGPCKTKKGWFPEPYMDLAQREPSIKIPMISKSMIFAW